VTVNLLMLHMLLWSLLELLLQGRLHPQNYHLYINYSSRVTLKYVRKTLNECVLAKIHTVLKNETYVIVQELFEMF